MGREGKGGRGWGGRETKRSSGKGREGKAARWGSPAGTNNGRQNAVGHPLPSFLKRREIGLWPAGGLVGVGYGQDFSFKRAEVTRSRQMWADVSPAVTVETYPAFAPPAFGDSPNRFLPSPILLSTHLWASLGYGARLRKLFSDLHCLLKRSLAWRIQIERIESCGIVSFRRE